ncbi:4Fe-4S ferredoxin iron-sulfur binding domain protein [Methanosalsum zhilinae DSM 4017]|uniref:4Fe-4S ferredoxin iron-sulfur binding domain protein n=1 Tax=Methanosalsum zhilinae (strain DSM 4017 / NBRC 107636 / OCM 62 / WeN5) TaxID=679901 RepID=F7XNE4_METZD|nr:4Fe-4S dicluster domain-containing protein [Methanosalsum zhilinae]AEH61194.1 4Fe-4S ferredoxin iron-sulfur binding domain protein [Methanosalsum zhilinae DSM 4017]
MKDITKSLIDNAFASGVDFIGITDPSCFEKKDYTGNRPQDVMPDLKSVVILGVAVPKGSFNTLPEGRAEYTNTLLAATATLRIVAYRLARLIESKGYMATISPSEGSEFGYWYADRRTLKANFSFKYAAYHAGLGNFGMNHLLITEDFGPKVRMTALLTDAPLESGTAELPFINQECKNCMKCIEICPAKALTSEGTIHRERCAEYMFNELGGLRCGLCIKICPLENIKQ